jgi:predicted dehydrogenase
MTPPVSIAVIGCGDVAFQRHLPAIAANPRVRLTATCDAISERAEHAANAFSAGRWTTDARGVFDDDAVDAVIIATPPWRTPELTIAALQAGKDVLAEKPMAMTKELARQVIAVEAASDRFVQIGFVLRHGPMFGTLRSWLQQGRLGSPLSFRIGIFDELLDAEGDPEHYARIMATLEHGAPCIHDGAHTMDHLHYLLGDRATSIASWGQKTQPRFAAANYNVAHIEFNGGHRARVEIGWFMPAFPRGEWDIIGPDGIASFLQAENRVVLQTADSEEVIALDEDWIESCFRHQLDSFIDGILTREPTGPGSRDGFARLSLCQAFEAGMAQAFASRRVDYQ